MVVIARDKTVSQVKKYLSFFNEKERFKNLRRLKIANKVVLGGHGDKLKIVKKLNPDIICLGYDQKVSIPNLKKQLKKLDLKPKIVRLKPFNPNKFKTGLLHKNSLIAIKNIDPTIITEPIYATKNNFLKKPLYQNRIILTRKNIAQKLKKVQDDLRHKGLSLKIWDCYRPLSVQKKMWKFMPDERYIGNPVKKPFHTRAAAVDCTLVDKKGKELIMPTKFDEFSPRAHRNYPKHSKTAKKNMLILEKAMVKHGFIPLPTEWWHFSDRNWQKYPVLDIPI